MAPSKTTTTVLLAAMVLTAALTATPASASSIACPVGGRCGHGGYRGGAPSLFGGGGKGLFGGRGGGPMDTWSPFSSALDRHWKATTGLAPQQKSTPEITETDAAFYVTIDTAGFTADELTIKVVGRELIVRGHHACVRPGRLCIHRDLAKSYSLLADVDLNRITSRRTHDGVLQIAVPKSGPRDILIETAVEHNDEPRAAALEADSTMAAMEDMAAAAHGQPPAPKVVDEDVTIETIDE